MYIGTAGFGFLTAGVQSQYGSLFGSILFALGLIAIVGYKLKLFTGTAGFIKKNEIGDLLIILMGNIVGCFMMGMLTRVSPVGDGIQIAAMNITFQIAENHMFFDLCVIAVHFECTLCIPRNYILRFVNYIPHKKPP